MNRILVTGANGFVGNALCQQLASKGFQIIAAVRQMEAGCFDGTIKTVSVGSIDDKTDWQGVIDRVETVIHLAARVHVMSDSATDSYDGYRRVNVDGTRHLAETAARKGVKRFIYLSSVKVNGEENPTAYTESDTPSPKDSYGVSKLEAEETLQTIADSSSMQVVILRPPLVYGPGVRANFLSLMRLVDQKIPLPFGHVANRRSLIYLGNLIDCIRCSVTHPNAGGQIFMVSDDRDLSISELVRLLADAMGSNVNLFPFPQKLLRAMAVLIGKQNVIDRLLGSLTVDISKIKKELSWEPPFTLEYGLQDTANWFKEKQEC